ncbi:beta-glucosidase 12-like [Senna tora]|uniref:Beta-glucosidase 12-like n=1 Tax=Senna tora TaxID=362788 RepID=A0A834X0M4_9FABA|nr:beta-glucosidase 12-like [Senna tora]
MNYKGGGVVLVLVIIFLFVLVIGSEATSSHKKELHRKDFPEDFLFGAAGSAYQFEGAANQGGRAPSIWDTFAHISGLTPSVTLFHWDLPQALEDAYGGFRSHKVVKDFEEYANLCFKEFGDRVKHWVTLNEPLTFSTQGYEVGVMAPGRCSEPHKNCLLGGDSTTEPYIVSHHLLLAHAAVVKIYRHNYQKYQKGEIGIVLNSGWNVPISESEADKAAALRALDFSLGWFMEPIHSGSYPFEMIGRAGKRLPNFTKEESHILKGSIDFLGLNYYSSTYAAHSSPCPPKVQTSSDDSCVNLTNDKNGVKIGPRAASDWLYIYPEGIYELLVYIKQKFSNPVIYITENGMDELNDGTKTLEDNMRIDYYRDHIYYVHKAIQSGGVDVKGYFAWSLLDNFEWAMGYSVRFGIIFVDFKDSQKRYPKKSADWFKKFFH